MANTRIFTAEQESLIRDSYAPFERTSRGAAPYRYRQEWSEHNLNALACKDGLSELYESSTALSVAEETELRDACTQCPLLFVCAETALVDKDVYSRQAGLSVRKVNKLSTLVGRHKLNAVAETAYDDPYRKAFFDVTAAVFSAISIFETTLDEARADVVQIHKAMDHDQDS